MRDDFAIFILTHGRPNDQKTYNLFRKHGYTGKIFLIVDDLDTTKDEYIRKYKDEVIVFDKMSVYEKTDTLTNKMHLAGILYARIAVDEVAKQKGIAVYAQVDDDLTAICLRKEENGRAVQKKLKNLDGVFDAYARFATIPGVWCVGMGTPNLFMGGTANSLNTMRRKISNVFIRNIKTDVNWIAVMNEDLITCVVENTIGHFMGTAAMAQVTTKEVAKGKNKCGMMDIYSAMTEYERAFYAVIANPAVCKVQGNNKGGFDIRMNLSGGVPQVISGRYQKARSQHEK